MAANRHEVASELRKIAGNSVYNEKALLLSIGFPCIMRRPELVQAVGRYLCGKTTSTDHIRLYEAAILLEEVPR